MGFGCGQAGIIEGFDSLLAIKSRKGFAGFGLTKALPVLRATLFFGGACFGFAGEAKIYKLCHGLVLSVAGPKYRLWDDEGCCFIDIIKFVCTQSLR
jgi:hypothetical protein